MIHVGRWTAVSGNIGFGSLAVAKSLSKELHCFQQEYMAFKVGSTWAACIVGVAVDAVSSSFDKG